MMYQKHLEFEVLNSVSSQLDQDQHCSWKIFTSKEFCNNWCMVLVPILWNEYWSPEPAVPHRDWRLWLRHLCQEVFKYYFLLNHTASINSWWLTERRPSPAIWRRSLFLVCLGLCFIFLRWQDEWQAYSSLICMPTASFRDPSCGTKLLFLNADRDSGQLDT